MINSGDPRRKILYLLRKSNTGLTTEQLCEALQVTAMAVQRPLTSLVEQGLVSSKQLPIHGKGRPARIYKISETADELFPKNYGPLAMDLLKQLREKEGVHRVRRLFEGIFKKSAERIREKMKGKDLPERVKTISAILSEENYLTEEKHLGNGKYVIRMLNCPISKVAKEFPQACTCEKRSLSQLLEADVQRDSHILKGDNYCSYIIQRKQ